jgi:hypothetical protein
MRKTPKKCKHCTWLHREGLECRDCNGHGFLRNDSKTYKRRSQENNEEQDKSKGGMT